MLCLFSNRSHRQIVVVTDNNFIDRGDTCHFCSRNDQFSLILWHSQTKGNTTGFHFDTRAIRSHDWAYYRMMHPLYPAPQPKPAPVKGTKRYRKAQAREKRKAKKAAVWNVLSIIDSLSAQNQTRTVV